MFNKIYECYCTYDLISFVIVHFAEVLSNEFMRGADMTGSVTLILVVFFTITSLILYHKVFTVYYFGSLTNNLIKELFGAFIVGFILTMVTLYFWWVAAIIIVLIGLSVAAKVDSPQGKKVILIAFVVMAIIVSIVGITTKKQAKEKKESEQESAAYEISRVIDCCI